MVRWQARLIGIPYGVLGFALPAFIGWCCRHEPGGGAVAGFLWVGVMARMIAWHGMWSVNSFAHWAGTKPYQNAISATNNYLVAIFSHGLLHPTVASASTPKACVCVCLCACR